MGRQIVKLSVLFSLLTGCSQKPEAPTGPGVSVRLSYPVLLAGQHRLVVKNDDESLTTTTVASGLNFPEFTLIDSKGQQYSILKVTSFGRKSTFLDMGTTPYRVFLEMQAEGTLSLAQAKSVVIAVVPSGTQAPAGVQSIAELIEACREDWKWK